ncbi:hypothetical protein [Streptomyces viridochromogenes]|uniref:Uncharacterized protein n=1 Tax=Streptomyces viridochromogenes Tue57 TaxID=1160705 RepID=L8PP27_STRVR|nr:hypothetical protein [Streptomyces viridochromogenes]ELS58245.1 hypothetical protein STVIR_0796 [Streptomyces viridochromogenes Tue57]
MPERRHITSAFCAARRQAVHVGGHQSCTGGDEQSAVGAAARMGSN